MSITLDIKRITSDYIIFPGVSNEDFRKLFAKEEKRDDEPFYEDIVICSTSGEFDETVKTSKKSIRTSNLIIVMLK